MNHRYLYMYKSGNKIEFCVYIVKLNTKQMIINQAQDQTVQLEQNGELALKMQKV